MKRLLFLALLFANQLLAQQTHILFLGNSYTYTNNMPDLLKQLALSGGDSITWDSNTPGGYTFQNHTQDVNSISKISSYPWDFVVLQGQSQEPSVDTAYVVANVFPYAHQLDSLIAQNDSCTQTVFFMTWGRKNGDAQNCVSYPPVCTYLGMQQQLHNRYLQMANDNQTIVGPVGDAWKNVIATNPSFDLYMSVESHPSLYGSYLTACVFYATIYKQTPLGLNYYGGLPTAEATFLQSIAGATVLDSLQLWNTNIYHPDPSFVFSQMTSTSINVINSDPNATSWYWDNGTGNGFVQGTANQILNFPSVGTYTFCLAISNGCYSDTSCQAFNLTTVGLNSTILSEFKVVQDFYSNNFTIEFPENSNGSFSIHIYDALGKEVVAMNSENKKVEFNDFIPGIYFISVEGNGVGFSGKKILIFSK